MYPRRLTVFPLPSNCPLPAEDAGIVGAFSILSYFNLVPPPSTECLLFARHWVILLHVENNQLWARNLYFPSLHFSLLQYWRLRKENNVTVKIFTVPPYAVGPQTTGWRPCSVDIRLGHVTHFRASDMQVEVTLPSISFHVFPSHTFSPYCPPAALRTLLRPCPGAPPASCTPTPHSWVPVHLPRTPESSAQTVQPASRPSRIYASECSPHCSGCPKACRVRNWAWAVESAAFTVQNGAGWVREQKRSWPQARGDFSLHGDVSAWSSTFWVVMNLYWPRKRGHTLFHSFWLGLHF